MFHLTFLTLSQKWKYQPDKCVKSAQIKQSIPQKDVIHVVPVSLLLPLNRFHIVLAFPS